MPAPTTGRWRSVRAGAFALLAAQITVLGHLVAGGGAPDLTLLVAMSLLLVGCLRGLGGRRHGFGPLLAAMVLTQVVFHLLLTLAEARHPMPGGQDDHPLRMWLFHAVAALVSAALLAYGERLLFVLSGWASRLIPQRASVPAVSGINCWIAVVDRQGTTLRDRLVEGALHRRGPPVGVVPLP